MNKEYTYLDGKVIVEDENGKKRVTEYSDKLDEILVQENLIEVMENRLSEVDKKIQDDDSRLKKDKKGIFSPLIQSIIMTAFIPLFLKLLIGDIASMPLGLPGSAFEAIFGNVSISAFITVVSGVLSTLLCGMFTLSNYSNYKELKRKLKGLGSEKKELEENLVIERQKLNELQESKQNKVETEQFIVKKVDDKAILEGLKAYFRLYYDCGYNEDVYARYYMNGTLHKKLGRYYTETGIEEIESYLEENTNIKKRMLEKQSNRR